MKLPSLCFRKHVAYVSVGDDRETEDWRLDDEKTDSSLFFKSVGDVFKKRKERNPSHALLERMFFTHTVVVSSGVPCGTPPGNKWSQHLDTALGCTPKPDSLALMIHRSEIASFV